MCFGNPVSSLRRVLPIFFLGLFARPVIAGDATAVERIFAGKEPGETTSYLLVLRAQADLSGAGSLKGRNERRRFVYEALRTTAEATQIDVRLRLAEAAVPFQAFYLVN